MVLHCRLLCLVDKASLGFRDGSAPSTKLATARSSSIEKRYVIVLSYGARREELYRVAGGLNIMKVSRIGIDSSVLYLHFNQRRCEE